MTKLVWLRRDLRVQDNPALYHACQASDQPVIALYTLMPDQWQQHDDAPAKIAFWLDALQSLQRQLTDLNISLQVVTTSMADLSQTLISFFKAHDINEVYFNRELEPDEAARDAALEKLCAQLNIQHYSFAQACLLAPGTVLKADGSPYVVFTPFKKSWQQVIATKDMALLPAPKRQAEMLVPSTDLTECLAQYSASYDKQTWPAAEAAALQRLDEFLYYHVSDYQRIRDYPGLAGTSQLSAYLSAGLLSAKQCWHAAQHVADDEGRQTWLNELVWRDFYKHIMVHFSRVAKHGAFNLSTEKIVWNDNPEHFAAWQQGQTGVPIVDAAMRQLKQTGWMHNRLRMVTAMFFSKNLFLNWRLGERHFIQHLIDGDLAANNGGWQWSASTGTDAAPYFRIFNPYRQSERFDPQGDFIRQYCPELSELNNKQIHCPPKMAGYPEPIVDVSQTRRYAIEAFKRNQS